MKFRELIQFVQRDMRMSHIYQPLLIRSLVDAGGSATVRQLAQAFCIQDESELMRYEQTIKKMPVPVLRKHGVIEQEGTLIRLSIKRLSFQQKAEIRRLCEHRMQEFMQKRGLKIWDYRLMDNPVPDSLRYRVLQSSDGRCALCGASKKEQPLDVDHIKPRSKGGQTKLENLQVLCARCNRAPPPPPPKGNKDDTDFRGELGIDVDADCPFCGERARRKAVEDCGTCLAMRDAYPVSEGHLLVIPIRHTRDFFTMTERERADANNLLRMLQKQLAVDDSSIVGFNVGVNCGEAAGQTVFHAHIHLIPRRKGDTRKPRGGVRGVIPNKMSYTTTH